MKVLVAGEWHSKIHETAAAGALETLGHEVVRFPWHAYFEGGGALRQLWRRAQNKYIRGPAVSRLNRDFVDLALATRPDAVFIYRGTHIRPATLSRIRQALPACVVAGYNNDDPFGPGQPRRLWRYFLDCLPLYDLTLAYRHHNLTEFKACGAPRVELLRSWYIAGQNHPMVLNEVERQAYGCDVVFIGHYEPDQRVACLEAIVRRGWTLLLFGPGYDWDPVIRDNPLLKHLAPVRLVWGDDYNRALSGARLALCFLSKLNRDTYTRRCFEVPATETVLLSEYTDDLAGLFAPDKEAVYFKDEHEMMAKIEHYLNDDAARLAVASAGLARVRADGHDVVSRMRQVVAWIAECRERRA